jgi:hypothetical protein
MHHWQTTIPGSLAAATTPAGFLRRTRTGESCLLPSSRSSFHFSKVANIAQPFPEISLEHSIADRIRKFDSWLSEFTLALLKKSVQDESCPDFLQCRASAIPTRRLQVRVPVLVILKSISFSPILLGGHLPKMGKSSVASRHSPFGLSNLSMLW